MTATHAPDAYEASVEADPDGRVVRYYPTRDGARISAGDALASLRDDRAFRDWLRGVLAGSDLPAYFWETPPLTAATLDAPWEFALIDAPSLRGVPAEPGAFAEHYRTDALAVAFPNLGGDAWLVAPCPGRDPGRDPGRCAHLADFTRHAEDAAQDALWRLTGETATARVGARPLWLSTCGTGIYWLHLRLDTRPKYYSYAPYRRPPP